MQRIINYPNLDYQKFDNHTYDKKTIRLFNMIVKSLII